MIGCVNDKRIETGKRIIQKYNMEEIETKAKLENQEKKDKIKVVALVYKKFTKELTWKILVQIKSIMKHGQPFKKKIPSNRANAIIFSYIGSKPFVC